MDETNGLRFILCNDEDEATIVTDYCDQHDLKYVLVWQLEVGDIRIDGKNDDPIIVWYVGTLDDQNKIIGLTNGKALL